MTCISVPGRRALACDADPSRPYRYVLLWNPVAGLGNRPRRWRSSTRPPVRGFCAVHAQLETSQHRAGDAMFHKDARAPTGFIRPATPGPEGTTPSGSPQSHPSPVIHFHHPIRPRYPISSSLRDPQHSNLRCMCALPPWNPLVGPRRLLRQSLRPHSPLAIGALRCRTTSPIRYFVNMRPSSPFRFSTFPFLRGR